MKNNLPKGWEVKKLVKEIPIIKTGVEKYNDEKLYYSTGSVNENSIVPEGKFKFHNRPARANRLVKENDVIQARMKETNKALLIDKRLSGSLFSTGFLQFRPHEHNYNSKLLYYYLRSPNFLKQRDEYATGSTQVALTDDGAENIDLVVPLFDQQERIADKLDSLFAKLKDAKTRLEKVSKLLNQLRQAVLYQAFTGKLTQDFRINQKNKQNADLIIRALQKEIENKKLTARQKEKLKKIYSYNDERSSDNLPEGWIYVRLNKLCSSFDYGTSKKSNKTGKIPVLRMGNIQNGEIDWTDLVYTSDKNEIKKYSLKPNTVLFNRTNSPELVGKTAIYRGEKPAIFAGYLIRINPYPILDPEYLNLALNTTYAKQFCLEVKTDGVSQSNINVQKLGTFEIPFCAIEEQKEIVKRVRRILQKIENTYLCIMKSMNIDKLEQSILSKAFRGELNV